MREVGVAPTQALHDGRLAAVTGAARGIGLVVSQVLAEAGAAVAMLDIDEAVHSKAAQLCGAGFDAVGYVADVSDEEQVAQTFSSVAKRGTILILVNNAGISLKPKGKRAGIEQLGLEQWRTVIDVNLTSAFLCSKAVIPGMRQAAWGRIINMSSQGGRTGGIFSSVDYAAAKAGVIGFSRTLAVELGNAGITVNCLAPGRVATDMAALSSEAALNDDYISRLPIPRMATADEIAQAILYLSSDAAGYTTGTSLDINGGGFMA